MTESKQNEITNRLYKLEKQNRYMKLGGLTIVLLVVATMLAGADKKPEIAEEIRAKRIVVVNEKGEERIELKSSKDGSLCSIADSNGTRRIELASLNGTSGLILRDQKEEIRVMILGHLGAAQFEMYNSKGVDGIKIITNDILPGCFVFDKTGKRAILITSDENGGLMGILNKTDESVVLLHADEYGNGVVGAFNRKGKGKTLTPGP